jgi:DNA adenine methylase
MSTKQKSSKVEPFLRWAGGKNWLIKHLDTLLPRSGFNNYHEPFLGGAAIFLSLNLYERAFLSDLNKDLIAVYKTLRKDPEEIIKILKNYRNTEEFYYSIRNQELDDEVRKAAKFIFLNQTSFNGIYRVNLKGKYNVPFGYRTKEFLDPEGLRAVSKALKKATLFHGDFDLIKENIKKKDLIFLDPPYTVSHNNNGFIKYNQKLFSLDDQKRLSQLIDYIKKRGAYYILTNAAHKTIEEIFEKGDRKLELNRASLIGGHNAVRGQTSEYIFTNT